MLLQRDNFKGFYLPTLGYGFKIKVALFLGHIRNYSPIKIITFKTGLISNSRKAISKLYFESEETLSYLKDANIPEGEAKRLYPESLSVLNSTIKLHKKINSIKLYMDLETMYKTEKMVDNFFEVESIIRRAAHQNTPIDKGDKTLNEMASKISQSLLTLNEI